MTAIAQISPTGVVIGVDTHNDVHVAVALDGLGRRIDSTTTPTTTAGYRKLVVWAEALGDVEAFGVEGTGSYRAALARHLRACDHHVIEVVRPDRQARRRNGKSDPADADAAARAVISGEATGTPKSGDDLVEMIRVLRVARSTAMKARTQALNALKSLVVTAPVELRDQLRGLSTAGLALPLDFYRSVCLLRSRWPASTQRSLTACSAVLSMNIAEPPDRLPRRMPGFGTLQAGGRLYVCSMAVEMAHPARPFTYEDLEGMPDDGYRREIIGGSLIVTPAPAGGHQRVTGNLFALLRAAETAETMAMVAPYDWKLLDGGSVQPDVMVIRREDFDAAGPLPASAVPLVVVEVLSPSNRTQDLMLKRDLYQRLEVPAYWIVDPSGLTMAALRLVSGEYTVESEGSGTFRTDWPFPLEVTPADLAR